MRPHLLLTTLLALVLAAFVGRSAGARADTGVPEPDGPLAPVLAPILEDPIFREADAALQVVDVRTGEELFAWRADRALVPASVQKLLTSAVALRTLGPAFRFYTTFYREHDAAIDADGVLHGDLYVKSTGDPTMVVETLWMLVRQLRVDGVAKVDGDVVFDDSFFDRERLIPGWRKKVDLANGPAYFAPLGALSVNYNAVSIAIAPGAEVGRPARVALDVPADVVAIDNQAITGRAGARGWTKIERRVDDDGVLHFTVSGVVPADAPVRRQYRAVVDPLAWYMSVFRYVAGLHGIEVTGEWRGGTVPEDAEPLVTHMSRPLSEILNQTNKFSSNFLAEHVLKAVGAAAAGEPGTTAKGLAVVRDYLTELGIPPEDYTLVNGSGLSRGARLSPAQVNAVLLDMYADPDLAPEYLASLSIAGVDGTLRKRFADAGPAGRVRGKTGSIDGVYGIAGYVRTEDDRIYAYTFIVNGFRRVRPVRALHDRVGEALLTSTAEPVEGLSAGEGTW